MDAPAIIVWFRNDLRLGDNPALAAAVQSGAPMLPVFIWSAEEEEPWQPGAASRWWLHQSLAELDNRLRELNSRLIIRRGPAGHALQQLLRESGAKTVLWNRRYEPAVIARDAHLKETLRQDGVRAESFNAALLNEPWTISNRSGKPYQVFTPYWKHCLAQMDPDKPLPAPRRWRAPREWPISLPLPELQLLPKFDWANGLRAAWQPGESGARAGLQRFLASRFENYNVQRDCPAAAATSRLSPHLHFGEISPRQIWHATAEAAQRRSIAPAIWRHSQFLTELGWREFAHHLLYHFPHTPAEPLRTEFKSFAWRTDAAWLAAWQKGRTGYPIVDAGMRELWNTGWMHNRVRMIVASFLVKDLRISWQQGARWFWDTLVDADLAQNTLGWQWTAGCGADAAPFFRIFNPVAQGAKFDPQGEYVRRWCPELRAVPDKWIHQPDRAPADILRSAGVEIGRDYPEPIVNHGTAREVALEAYARMKGKN